MKIHKVLAVIQDEERTKLQKSISDYFNEKIAIDNYRIIKSGSVLNIIGNDGGFLFAEQEGNTHGYKERMEDIRNTYQHLGREIIREFCDYKNELAGFSWRMDVEDRIW